MNCLSFKHTLQSNTTTKVEYFEKQKSIQETPANHNRVPFTTPLLPFKRAQRRRILPHSPTHSIEDFEYRQHCLFGDHNVSCSTVSLSSSQSHNNLLCFQIEESILFTLPKDVLSYLCEFFSPKLLMNFTQTCKRFNSLVNENHTYYWTKLIQKYFGENALNSTLYTDPKYNFYVLSKNIFSHAEFINRPIPKEYGTIYSKIFRRKGVIVMSIDRREHSKKKTNLVYNRSLFQDGRKKELLYARKTSKGYVIASDAKFSNIVGRLKYNNLTRTRFIIENQQKERIGNIAYNLNIFGFNGPRQFLFTMPPINESTNSIDTENYLHSKKSVKYESKPECEIEKNCIWIPNTQPHWANGQYVLDFGFRALLSSVNNFKIEYDNENWWLLGRCHKDYSLDFKAPFSPLQAFGLALSCLSTHRNGFVVNFFDQ